MIESGCIAVGYPPLEGRDLEDEKCRLGLDDWKKYYRAPTGYWATIKEIKDGSWVLNNNIPEEYRLRLSMMGGINMKTGEATYGRFWNLPTDVDTEHNAELEHLWVISYAYGMQCTTSLCSEMKAFEEMI